MTGGSGVRLCDVLRFRVPFAFYVLAFLLIHIFERVLGVSQGFTVPSD